MQMLLYVKCYIASSSANTVTPDEVISLKINQMIRDRWTEPSFRKVNDIISRINKKVSEFVEMCKQRLAIYMANKEVFGWIIVHNLYI